jgi:hypothetical protein
MIRFISPPSAGSGRARGEAFEDLDVGFHPQRQHRDQSLAAAIAFQMRAQVRPGQPSP